VGVWVYEGVGVAVTVAEGAVVRVAVEVTAAISVGRGVAVGAGSKVVQARLAAARALTAHAGHATLFPLSPRAPR
jgi:hypothetical protein